MLKPPLLIIIIPYRDRATNLARVVPALHAHLSRVPHKIAVIEQAGSEAFNKGRLMNAGFHLHRSENAYFCFHDVDLIPERPSCDYSYPKSPTHLSVYCSQLGYKLPYQWLCGGVMLFRKSHFVAVNGYSNEYWGWGAEDDDMGFRLRHFHLPIDRSRPGRYRSLPHERSAGQGSTLHRRNLTRLWSRYDYKQDGLSTLRYRVLSAGEGPGYTRYLIDIGLPPPQLRRPPSRSLSTTAAARPIALRGAKALPRVSQPDASVGRRISQPDAKLSMQSKPFVSCLCVTESRAAFLPWLLWSFDRQTWKDRELVIVDSSSTPISLPARPGVRIVRAPKGTTLPEKRNIALDAARGETLAWFDDDDWQHPDRLAELVEVLRGGAAYAGTTRGWFVDLLGAGASLYTSSTIIFNGALFWRDVALSSRFDSTRARGGEDTAWMRSLAGKPGEKGRALSKDMFFWLSHDRNIMNSRSRRRFLMSRADVKNAIGNAAWGDTDLQLEQLRQRYLQRSPVLVPRVRPRAFLGGTASGLAAATLLRLR